MNEEEKSTSPVKSQVFEDLFAVIRNEISSSNDLKEKIQNIVISLLNEKTKKDNEKFENLTNTQNQLEEMFQASNQNQTQLIIELNEKHKDDISALKTDKETQKNELNAINSSFTEQVKNLMNNISILNEANQNQAKEQAELKNMHDNDILVFEKYKKTQNNALSALNFTFFEQIHSLDKKFSLLNESNQIQIQNLAKLKHYIEYEALTLKKVKETQNNELTALNSTFNEQVQDLKDKIRLMSNIINDIYKTLMINDIKKTESVPKKENDINETLIEDSSINKKKPTVYSLAHNVSIKNMKLQGYELVYDFAYNHSTEITELNAIRWKCSAQSVLCVGGAALDSDNLLLVSCGNCHAVLKETSNNKPVLNNEAYWYLTEKKSFGFSPSFNIKQLSVDWHDCDSSAKNCSDDKRLSWYLGGGGGWRLGKLNNVENEMSDYRKIILFSSG